MHKPLFTENSIVVNAPAEQVWGALTSPELTKQYMFGCEAVSTWQPGSELLWKGEYEGREMVFVKGIILQIEPPSLLVYTTIDPNAAIEDISENYLRVTYRLEEKEGLTELTVTQGDYAAVAEGERRYKEAYNNGEGWNPILIQIKALVEKQG